MPPRYRYLGPDALRLRALAEPAGFAVRDRAALDRWLREHPDALREGATFVLDDAATLRLAPRRSEHVGCAEGRDVLTAGEIRFARGPRGAAYVAEVSNQSTGYCPEPESFAVLAAALAALGVDFPAQWTHAFVFRRCPRCAQLALVKDDVYECAACDAPLPRARNL